MTRIQVGALQMAVDDSGSGPAVVMVHGFPLNRTMWRRQRRRLSDFRVIVPDLRGFGQSSLVPPFSMAAYAADLTGLLDRLGIEDAVFCGLSMGGYVLFELFRAAPNRVKAMILISTRADADDAPTKAKRNALIERIHDLGHTALVEAMIGRLVAEKTLRERPAVVSEVERQIESGPLEGMVGALEAMRDRADSSALLERIPIPCLVISGEHDPITPADEMRDMASRIPGSRFSIIAEAGHLSPIEQPREVNRIVAGFLATL